MAHAIAYYTVAMTTDTLWALVVFAFATSITPGPNNLMLLASGVNFGFRASIPHMLGISCGFMFLLSCIGLGLGQLLKTWPSLEGILKWVGAAYMVYLAWGVARSSAPQDHANHASQSHSNGNAAAMAKPMSFLGAAGFQWVNPKAWMMALGAVSAYVPAQGGMVWVFVAALVFGVLNFPTISLWVIGGTQLRRWLQDPKRLRLFNWGMAALLLLSLIPMLR